MINISQVRSTTWKKEVLACTYISNTIRQGCNGEVNARIETKIKGIYVQDAQYGNDLQISL